MPAAEVRCVGGAGTTCAGFSATGGWMVGAGIGGALVLFWSAGGTGTARCGDCSVALLLSLVLSLVRSTCFMPARLWTGPWGSGCMLRQRARPVWCFARSTRPYSSGATSPPANERCSVRIRLLTGVT